MYQIEALIDFINFEKQFHTLRNLASFILLVAFQANVRNTLGIIWESSSM